ncbi:MAG: hypothetical protein ACLPWS_11640 [Rhodomicrobium sp.]
MMEIFPAPCRECTAFRPATLIFDLQYRFRCSHCGRHDGFGITLRDERDRGGSAKSGNRRVIVPGREWHEEA